MEPRETYEVWARTGGFEPRRWGLYKLLSREGAEAHRDRLNEHDRKFARPEAAARRFFVVKATTTYEEVS